MRHSGRLELSSSAWCLGIRETKGGNAATMKDIAENEEVSGLYWKNADGSLEARTVTIAR